MVDKTDGKILHESDGHFPIWNPERDRVNLTLPRVTYHVTYTLVRHASSYHVHFAAPNEVIFVTRDFVFAV